MNEPAEVTSLPSRQAKDVGANSSQSPVTKWLSEHPVWTILGAFALVSGLVTTVLLANIQMVGDNVTAVQTDVRELRNDVDEVKDELQDLNREVGYIKGRLDQNRSGASVPMTEAIPK